jgi:DNA-binding CsgD family transcriptional regulator
VTPSSPLQATGPSAPIVGRDDTLAALRHELGADRSVLLSGVAGVGKTRLAQAAAAEQRARGASLVEVLGTSSSADVPLGPCAHLVPPLAGSVPVAGLIAATLEGLRRLAAAGPVVVVADDIDALDNASAILVAHLVELDGVAVLATIRESVRIPRPLGGLIRQGRLRTRTVEPLAPAHVAALSATLAGGPLDAESDRRIYQATGGNALWVTELLRAAVARQALRPGPRGLRLDTAAAVVGLDRVITERLDDLAAEERDAVELLAVGGPLPLDLLEKLVGTGPPETLATVGLVTVKGLGEALTVTLSHPLHQECLLAEVNGIRRRTLFRRLVASTGDLGRSDPATLVRLALWHAELGESFDPAALGWASQAVHWGLFELVRRHLSGTGPGPDEEEAGLAVGLKTSQERSEVARRLAVGAWQAEPNFAHGLALARALLMRTDQAAEMVAVLDALAGLARTDEERAWRAVTHGVWLYWTVGDRAGAAVELGRAETTVGPPWDQVIVSTRGGLDIHSGKIAGGLGLLEATMPDDSAPPAVRVAHDSPMTAGLVLAGRSLDALAMAEQALPLALGQGNDGMAAMAEMLLSTSWAKLALGRYAELAAESHALAELLAEADDHEGGALFAGIEARCLLYEGRPVSAARLLEDAIHRHGPFSMFGFLPLIHTTRAWALAWSGRAADALAEAAEARRVHVAPRFFDAELDLVEALALAGLNRRSRALTLATRARDDAAAAECWYYSYLAAYLVVRLEPTASNLTGLCDAAAHVDGEPAALAVDHGGALVAGDPRALQQLAVRAGEQGDRLLAVEMLEAAVSSAGASRSLVLLARVQAQLDQLRSDCEGARSPLAPELGRPRGLTSRELEIVTLAAEGWTSAAISRELVVSVRTVESHLYRAFAKLGVRHRDELPAALADR